MGDVVRIYPESKTGLIKWIEDNFHDIDTFVVTFKMKNNQTMTVYDCYTFLEALGIVSISQSTLYELGSEGEFMCKERDDK